MNYTVFLYHMKVWSRCFWFLLSGESLSFFSCSFRRISTPFLFLSVSSHLFISSFLASPPLCGTHHVSFTRSSSLHPQLQLWDTAGQERFRKSMVQHYYRNVHAVLFVYDVTCAASFASLTSWVEECRQNSLGHELPRYLPLKGYEIHFWFQELRLVL